MRNWFVDNKMLVMSTCTLLVCLALSWTLFGLFGHRLIEAMYKGESVEILNGIFQGRAIIPLENYYQEADRIMWRSTFWAVTLFLILAITIKTHFLGKVALTIGSLLLSTLLLFSLFELFPSLIKPVHLQNIKYYAVREHLIPDETLVYRHRPSYTTRTYNFRGDHYSQLYGIQAQPIPSDYSYDEHGFRSNFTTPASDIVVIGDSYIEVGHDEADTFAKRLEHKLSSVTVANLGIGGYGPFQYLEVLKRHGVNKQPKYVLLCFYEGNDIADIREYIRWKEGYGDYWGTANALSGDFIQRYFTALREAVNYIRNAVWLGAQLTLSRIRQNGGDIHPDIAVVHIGNRLHKVVFSSKLNRGLTRTTPEEISGSDEWQELKRILIEFKNVCADNNIIPIIIYIPTASHIYAEFTNEHSGHNWLKIRDEQIAGKANVESAMVDLARELNLKLISLSQVYELAARDGKMLYYPFDSHWNSEGREVAAAFVAERLRHQLFVSPKRGWKKIKPSWM